MLNRLMLTEPKNLILSHVVNVGREKQYQIGEFGFQLFQFLQFEIVSSIYLNLLYIYVCVCVCVCVRGNIRPRLVRLLSV